MTNILAAAALIASQIGAPLPADIPAASVPAAVAAPLPAARAAAASGYVSASGYLSGSVSLYCNAPQNGSGWMNGSGNLTAQMRVDGPNGEHGTIPVSGFIQLSGSCRNGSGGFVSGSTSVSGYGPLYSRDGKYAGTVSLNGSVFVNQYASGHIWINQYATVNGYFTANPAN